MEDLLFYKKTKEKKDNNLIWMGSSSYIFFHSLTMDNPKQLLHLYKLENRHNGL